MRRVMARAEVWQHDGEVIEVRWPVRPPHPAGRPAKRLRVHKVLDEWDYGGRWWLGEPCRHYLLLEGGGGRVVEIYREGTPSSTVELTENEEGGRWWLSRISD